MIVICISLIFLTSCSIPLATPGDGICEHSWINSEITGYRVNTSITNWQGLMIADCGGTYTDITCSDNDIANDPLVRGELIVDTANSLLKSKAPIETFLSGNDTCVDSSVLVQGTCGAYNLLNITQPYDCSARGDGKTACYNGRCVIPDFTAPTVMIDYSVINNTMVFCVNCLDGIRTDQLNISGSAVDETLDSCSYDLSGIKTGSLQIIGDQFNGSINLSGLDADYNLKITCTDTNGNQGNDTINNIKIDRIMPTVGFKDPAIDNPAVLYEPSKRSLTGTITLEANSNDTDLDVIEFLYMFWQNGTLNETPIEWAGGSNPIVIWDSTPVNFLEGDLRTRAFDDANNWKDALYTTEIDNLPPSTILDLKAEPHPQYNDGILLKWTGANDSIEIGGTITGYEIRKSVNPILNENDWNNAQSVQIFACGIATPNALQDCNVVGITTGGTTPYHFAVKSKDEHNKWSALSNTASNVTPIFDAEALSITYSTEGLSSYTNYAFDNITFIGTLRNNGNVPQNISASLVEDSIPIQTKYVYLLAGQNKTINYTTAITPRPDSPSTIRVYGMSVSPQGPDQASGNNLVNKDINVINVSDHIGFTWKDAATNPNSQYTYGSDIISMINATKTISDDIYALPVEINITQAFTITQTSNGCGINTKCYLNMTSNLKNQAWRTTTLPVGQYTIKVKAGKYETDMKYVERNVTVTYCANNITDTLGDDGIPSGDDEECDDGNWNDTDGCSSICKIEPGYTCTGEPSICSLI